MRTVKEEIDRVTKLYNHLQEAYCLVESRDGLSEPIRDAMLTAKGLRDGLHIALMFMPCDEAACDHNQDRS
jgi:hypothetical protein